MSTHNGSVFLHGSTETCSDPIFLLRPRSASSTLEPFSVSNVRTFLSSTVRVSGFACSPVIVETPVEIRFRFQITPEVPLGVLSAQTKGPGSVSGSRSGQSDLQHYSYYTRLLHRDGPFSRPHTHTTTDVVPTAVPGGFGTRPLCLLMTSVRGGLFIVRLPY